MKRCSPVLNTFSGVGEPPLPILREYFRTSLNRQGPPAPELEYIHKPKYAVKEVLVRIQEMENQKSGGDLKISEVFFGCTTSFEVVTGVRQGTVAELFPHVQLRHRLYHGENSRPMSSDFVLAPIVCSFTDLEYASDIIIFAENSTKLQNVVILVSKPMDYVYGLMDTSTCGFIGNNTASRKILSKDALRPLLHPPS
ncbi:hypothetical protein RB195_013022 [Necator americanus]